uniref:ATP-dependent RNA helicase n=1 Tax=Chromera velia CCMP2878 TaxID=1169474 RepID=A0A0G4GA42_9ALVE|eukprot:Cvel_20964.t1-p1 / transcript=Cvel_20964.t1 / gene=Cvel_20964 / organism=Chromera_velia_CCMP2878 / gene_product=DEAD-box ATP-dependent RNA helicase 26, putative / transcript_product=DEAD-box ATP-dependent RNA helicase 26, putative / location=Cvel_scaffold1927:11125-16331(-) / protein_length=561 / sequence_SO=supercontig / SO=protein_coding / is_pseudo=false
MTQTQAAMLSQALQEPGGVDADLLVQARTGSGKTLGFLVPLVERLRRKPCVGVGGLVLAPTRELVLQLSREAEQLLSFQPLTVLPLVGGISRREDQKNIRRTKPHVIIATPGRLLDHLEGSFLFHTLFEDLQVLVLDEADRLLDMGFTDTLRSISGYLPESRTTFLVSATINKTVEQVAGKVCRKKFKFLDCRRKASRGDREREEEEEGTQTLAAPPPEIQQRAVVHPSDSTAVCLFNVIMEEMRRDPFRHKILVFFPTARMTSFFALFFREQFRLASYEMHRRKDTASRLHTMQRFMKDEAAVMFSSDISSRGMDYPDVSLVVQVGAPQTRDQYVHRVGRTGRGGKFGRSVLLLSEPEGSFLDLIGDLKVRTQSTQSDAEAQKLLCHNELTAMGVSSWQANSQLIYAAQGAFASLLLHFGFLRTKLKMSDDDVIRVASGALLSCGMSDQPVVSRRLATDLQLWGNPLLKTSAALDDDEDPRDLAASFLNRQRQQEQERRVAETGEFDTGPAGDWVRGKQARGRSLRREKETDPEIRKQWTDSSMRRALGDLRKEEGQKVF